MGRCAQVSQVLLPSVARTATPTAFEHDGDDYTGVNVIIDVSAASATPSVVVTIEGFDVASGTWVSLLASAAITGISKTVMTVSPDGGTVANVSRQMRLPRRWRVQPTHADADSITYSIGAWLEEG